MRNWLMLGVLLLPACAAEMSDDDPPDADLYYAPCSANPHCGMGSGIAIQSGGGGGMACRCVVYCESDSDCPVPSTGSVTPVCVEDDVVDNGMSGECDLPCTEDSQCPDGFECQGNSCMFPN